MMSIFFFFSFRRNLKKAIRYQTYTIARILFDGYAYIFDKQDNITNWRWEHNGKCEGRLKTKADVIQGEPSDHPHPPAAGRNLALKTVQESKDRAKVSEEVTSTGVHNITSEEPLIDAAGALPKNENPATMARRQRTAPDG